MRIRTYASPRKWSKSHGSSIHLGAQADVTVHAIPEPDQEMPWKVLGNLRPLWVACVPASLRGQRCWLSEHAIVIARPSSTKRAVALYETVLRQALWSYEDQTSR